jgi:sugar transferase (PEP-CTERM/EpsH1 system associated)
MAPVPLIAHVVYRFDVGGLENGMVNLLNHLPADRYRHAVICLDAFTDYRQRIRSSDVSFHALHKRPGKDPALYLRLWRLLRQLRPDIVHTRNLSALEGQLVAALAGARARVHGEHGRDVFDLHGVTRRYNILRRALRPLVGRYITVSRDLEGWLVDTVGVERRRIAQIYNGVDARRFHPRADGFRAVGPAGFFSGSEVIIGTVGRMAAVKDHPTLVRAFIELVVGAPALRKRVRLIIVGDGPARGECLALLAEAGMESLAWLPGERDAVPDLMRTFDVFALPSLGEGISNTILEAMATGLPVVATRVGGNPELVEESVTGALVPVGMHRALAAALRTYVDDTALARRHGANARKRAEEQFSIDAMVAGYLSVYDSVLAARLPKEAAAVEASGGLAAGPRPRPHLVRHPPFREGE